MFAVRHLIAFTMLFASFRAGALPVSVAASANPQCVGDASDQPMKNYSVSGNTNSNTPLLVAQVMNKLASVGGKNPNVKKALSQITSVTFTDLTKMGHGSEVGGLTSGGKIYIASKWEGSRAILVGLLAHEMCHVIGHTKCTVSGGGGYGAYNSAVGASRCQVSTYATNTISASGASNGTSSRNEEFAEACSAYVVAPDKLAKAGGSCGSAYNFMKNTVFAGEPPKCNGFNSQNYQASLGKAHQISGGPTSDGTNMYSSYQMQPGETNWFTGFAGLLNGQGLVKSSDLMDKDEDSDTESVDTQSTDDSTDSGTPGTDATVEKNTTPANTLPNTEGRPN